MKREFLEDVDLTKGQVDSIMTKNGSDIESVKGGLEQTRTKLGQTKTWSQERDTQAEALKNSVGDMDTPKQQITSLQSDSQATKEKYEADMEELKLSTSIKLVLGDPVQDVGLVAGLFDKPRLTLSDDGKITGLGEQLKTIKESKLLLFKESSPKPSSFQPLGAGLQDPRLDNDDSKVSIRSATEAKTTSQLSQ